MSVEERIRGLVTEGGGRAAIEDVVARGLGVSGALGSMARSLVEAAVAPLRDLVVEGDEVVERATPAPSGPAVALAVATSPSRTLLPPELAWVPVPRSVEAARLRILSGSDWRRQLVELAAELAGKEVLCLSAVTARRTLRLASSLAGLMPDEEPRVTALGPVARVLERPLRSAEQAAALVGQPVPESTDRAAEVLAELAAFLADLAGVGPAELGELAAADLAPRFDFGERAFDRGDVLALPEAPGVYLFEDAEGEVLYVGKGKNLCRRVADYFGDRVDDRVERIRSAAHRLSHERTGSELSALLREHELIGDLEPPLNVQERVHARGREVAAGVRDLQRLAIVQPSAEGGAEVVLIDRQRGTSVLSVLPEGAAAEARGELRLAMQELAARPVNDGSGPETVELALSWLADHGAAVSVLDAAGEGGEVADLVLRVAGDPDLGEGRIVVA